MLLTEYNETEQMELFREDGLKEGLERGRTEGTLDTLISLVEDGILTVADAAARVGITEEAFGQKMQEKLQ